MNVQQLATLFALLADNSYTMRSAQSLTAKTGATFDDIINALDSNDINFEVRTRRSDGAKMIEVLP